jgi:myb proto-oncogene protein
LSHPIRGTPKNKWTAAEDAMLTAAVAEFGLFDWPRVAVKVPGRTGKQCRERWVDKLSPDVALGEWSAEEDSILLAKESEFGHAWSKIREFLPGRSTGAVKNRWSWLNRRPVPIHEETFRAIAAFQAIEKDDTADFSMDFGMDLCWDTI